MVDYINELREGCLEAYTGIVQGLKGDNDKQMNRKICGVYIHVYRVSSFFLWKNYDMHPCIELEKVLPGNIYI